MKQSLRDIVLAVLTIALLGIASPLIFLPMIAGFLGFNCFKGLQGFRVGVGGGVIPVPILKTPDSYTIIGFLASSMLLATYIILRGGAVERALIRRQLSDTIAILSSYARTGIPIAVALERASEAVEMPMKMYLYRYAKLLQLGYDPFEGFDEVFASAPREVRVVLSALPVAAVSGGRVADVLTQAEKFSFQLTRLEDLRRARLESYKGILLLAVIAYIATAIVINILISYLAKLGAGTPILKGAIDLAYSYSLYYISAVIVSVVSSVAISRVIYGETVYAFKYSSALIALTSLAFAVALAVT
jgi:hypothetical protein